MLGNHGSSSLEDASVLQVLTQYLAVHQEKSPYAQQSAKVGISAMKGTNTVIMVLKRFGVGVVLSNKATRFNGFLTSSEAGSQVLGTKVPASHKPPLAPRA